MVDTVNGANMPNVVLNVEKVSQNANEHAIIHYQATVDKAVKDSANRQKQKPVKSKNVQVSIYYWEFKILLVYFGFVKPVKLY